MDKIAFTMRLVTCAKLYAPRATPCLISLIFLLYFWSIGISNLDRFPKIHEDESWQAAPGYTFWAEGRFGTDLFAGFYGMEKHFYAFMPLFPIMVGAALHSFGLGLFQARLVPLILITLTLALTHRLGAKLFTPWHGAIAVTVLATWRIAGPFPHLASGIPMADVARIVRYDSAVPIFGLLALLILVAALSHHSPASLPLRSSTRLSFFAIGLLTGLATLSHVYGVFWLPALLLPTFWILGWRTLKLAMAAGAGFGVTLFPWLVFVASGWDDFVNQTRNYSARFGLIEARFYLINLMTEIERYDPILNGAKQALGPWLWLIMAGISLIWLLRLGITGKSSPSSQTITSDKTRRSSQILVGSLTTLMALFAVLVAFKTFSYLATLWPLFAVVLAVGFIHVWQARTTHRWWRPLLILILGMVVAEGVLTGWQIQRVARRTTPYQAYTQAIGSHVSSNSRLMGLQHYWLGLAQESRNYRSILVPIYWTNPDYVLQPVSFSRAAQAHSPQFILLDQIMLDFLTEAADSSHDFHGLGLEIWNYLEQQDARLIAELDDPTYRRLQIYQLYANSP